MGRQNWYEDDDFWIEFSDFLFPEERYAQAERLLKESPLLDFPAGSRILDVSATRASSLRRWPVVVTPSPVSTVAPRCWSGPITGASHGHDWSLRISLNASGRWAFDVMLNMCTSFGYFQDPADNAWVLQTMYRSLVPGRQLILDVAGKEILAGRALVPKVVYRGDDPLVQTDSVLADWARLRSDWVLVRGERAQRASLVWFMYSAVELRQLRAEAGFGSVEVFGGFAGEPYDERAERLIVRAVRTE